MRRKGMNMKSILMSIKPQYLELIACGRKKLEFRKVIPKLEEPYKVYLYQTKHKWLYKILKGLGFEKYYDILTNNSGKVVGEFICDYVMRHCEMANADLAEQQGWMKREKILEYANGKEVFGLRITNLVIYDKPKELSEFAKANFPTFDEMNDDGSICQYCPATNFGQDFVNGVPDDFQCDVDCYDAYEDYAAQNRFLTRPPQSWCYAEVSNEV